jgi:hypothetical protein
MAVVRERISDRRASWISLFGKRLLILPADFIYTKKEADRATKERKSTEGNKL